MQHRLPNVCDGHAVRELLPVQRDLQRPRMRPLRRPNADLEPQQLVGRIRVVRTRAKAELPLHGRCPRNQADAVSDDLVVQSNAKAVRGLVCYLNVKLHRAAWYGDRELEEDHIGKDNAQARAARVDEADAKSVAAALDAECVRGDLRRVHEAEAVRLVRREPPPERGGK